MDDSQRGCSRALAVFWLDVTKPGTHRSCLQEPEPGKHIVTHSEKPVPQKTQKKTKPMNTPFLPPIEKPKGLIMKLVYAMTRKQYGKVLTPLKVYAARMPVAFGSFYGKISVLDKKLQLPRQTMFLVREQVARNNVCLFCTDIGRFFAMKEAIDEAKIDALPEYSTSPLFTEAERAALDYVTELTREKKVSPETFERLAAHYSEREICEIVWLVASEHIYNITNLGLNIHSDMLCDISWRGATAARG